MLRMALRETAGAAVLIDVAEIPPGARVNRIAAAPANHPVPTSIPSGGVTDRDTLGHSPPGLSAPSRIRTCGLLLRRESLYPAELSGLRRRR